MTILESFTRFLQDSQIQYTINENTVSFEKDSLNYVLLLSPNDHSYFRLMLPRVVNIDDGRRGNLERIALTLSTKYKVGKVISFDNSIWLSFEVFIYSFDADYTNMYNRAIRILRLMLEDFRSSMNNEN